MRISNLGSINLGPVSFGDGTFCSILPEGNVDPQLDQLSYTVTSSDGLQVSGNLPGQEYVQITPQGTAPFTATLNYPNRDVGPIEVQDIKAGDFDLAVVYVSPSGTSIVGPPTLNGPYAWVTQPQSL